MARPKNTTAVQNECSISATENGSHELDDSAFDPDKLRTRMRALGIETVTELAQRADLSRGTLHEFLRTGNGSDKTIKAVLGVLNSTPRELQRQPARQELAEQAHRLTPPNDWEVVSVLTSPLVAANGVSYQVAKLKSNLTRHRYARGKFYDLLHVPSARLPELIERLTRHSSVCALLHDEPRIAKHFDIRKLDENTAWWVLDEWVDSTPLGELIDAGVKFTPAQVKQIGLDLLDGLITLHGRNVIVRELAPERILMLDGSPHCLITDFELAKLLDSDISVSGKWKMISPYRAPEINEHDSYVQSDLFSWAAILCELLTGRTDADAEQLRSVVSNKKITQLLLQCRDVRYHHRPTTATKVLASWKGWKV